MKMSVVICAHQRPELLGEILAALASQTVAPEIIVVDDSPAPQLATGANMIYTWEPWDGGYHRVSKYNLGIELATGDGIILLDDDCVPQSAWFVESHMVDLQRWEVVRGCFLHEGQFKFTPWFSTTNISFWKGQLSFDPAYDGHYGYEDLDLELVYRNRQVEVGLGSSGTAVEHKGVSYSGLRDQTNERYYRKKWGFAPI